VSHCGPLQRGSRSGAFLLRAVASGLRSRWPDCWRRPALSQTQASPWPRETPQGSQVGADHAARSSTGELKGAEDQDSLHNPARSIFSNALNFRRSAIAPLVHSPCRYWPLRSPGGPPLPAAPPCNRHRPFLVAGHRQGLPLLVRAPHRRGGLQFDRPVFSSSVVLPASGARAPFRSSPLQKRHP
jgi:hypothetical protein